MRKLQCRVFFVIIATIGIMGILAPTLALCQGKPVSILVSSETRPASAGKAGKSYADFFEDKVWDLLRDEYPCADVNTKSGIAAVLRLQAQRELLTGSDEDLSAAAAAIGARYVINLTVTYNGSGLMGLNAMMFDTRSGNLTVISRSSSETSEGDAALDAIEALAKQFVDSLSSLTPFSKSKCNPTNPWTGTITYQLKQTPPADSNVRAAVSGKGTVTTTTTHTVNDQVRIKIRWTGSPEAEIEMMESSQSEDKGIVQMDCARPTIASNAHDFKSGGWDHVEIMDETAHGFEVAAAVSVTIANGRYKIVLNVPAIQGEAKRTLRKHDDGGCGKPHDDNPDPIKYVWNAMVTLPVIDQPLSSKPDELHSSQDDGYGGKVVWNLTRTPMRK